MEDRVNVLVLTPERGWRLYKKVVVRDGVLSLNGNIYKVPWEAVHVSPDGKKLVVLYSTFPAAVKTELCQRARDVELCALSASAVHKYVMETLSPKILWLIKERYVAEVYKPPRKWVVLLTFLLAFVLGLMVGWLV